MNDTQSRLLTDAMFVAAYAGVMWLGWWLFTHPDEIDQYKMRYLKEMESKSMRNATFWANRADTYRIAYEGMRQVTA
jgi:hypothetical protein